MQVSPANNTTNITLFLNTSTGTGSATFANGNTQMIISSSQAVTINGVTASSTANNIALLAILGAQTLASQAFSMVWVTISMNATQGATPSQNDANRSAFLSGAAGLASTPSLRSRVRRHIAPWRSSSLGR